MPTQDNLQAAFAGESQANRKYLAFAAKAEAEGFPQIARLFRAAAAAETVHALAHFRVMKGVADTKQNLQAAIDGEEHEFKEMYPGFIEIAEKEGNRAAVVSFRNANAVEKTHFDLYSKALETLTAGKDLSPASIFVCDVCGHTHVGEAPDKCPRLRCAQIEVQGSGMILASLFISALLTADPMLKPGDHTRTLKVDGRDRSYLVHIPKKYDGKTPTPVVLALHGAAMNGPMMAVFCGLNKKADDAGFIAVYPSGGAGMGMFLTWNAGGRTGKDRVDDVAYIRAALDDLGSVVKVDPKRVYATGMSNGGMMCYLLAAELSDRIAAVAPVAGTMVIEKADPKRPVPLIHFHGTADTLVKFDGPGKGTPKFIHFKSVEDSIQTWVKIDGCDEKPEIVSLPDKAKDGTTIERKTFGHGKDGAEVVLVVIKGGGHTWPGQEPIVGFIGKSTKNISANDAIWEFFQKHPMK